MAFEIREAVYGDLAGVLQLYAQFGKEPPACGPGRIQTVWNEKLSNKNQHPIVGYLADFHDRLFANLSIFS